MKNLKKFLAVLLAAAMVTGFSGSVCRAKTKPDIYGDLDVYKRQLMKSVWIHDFGIVHWKMNNR